MASLNKVTLLGNLTRDPQARTTPGGTSVTELGLAINRSWFDKTTRQKKEETTFVDVALFGSQADVAGRFLTKGKRVLIEGRLQLDRWADKETGEQRSRLRVIGEQLHLIDGAGRGSDEGGQPGKSQVEASRSPQRQPAGVARGRGPAPDEIDAPF